MNDPENFLTRWSRRKREAGDGSDRAAGDDHAQRTPDAPPAERADLHPSPPPSSSAAVSAPPETALDLTKLPAIESITAETDISVFLAPGVPADLRLAALRRAWVADPKVRNFVGLNDYDFDFHTPGAIPGFGSLEVTDELRREAMRIVSAWQPQPEPTDTAAAEPSGDVATPGMPSAQPAATTEETHAPGKNVADAPAAATGQVVHDQDELIGKEATTRRNIDDAAPQQDHSAPSNLQTLARRGHGRALPK